MRLPLIRHFAYLFVPRLSQSAYVKQVPPGHEIGTHLFKHHIVAKMLIPNMVQVLDPTRRRARFIRETTVTKYAKSFCWWTKFSEVRQHMIMKFLTGTQPLVAGRLEDVLEKARALNEFLI